MKKRSLLLVLVLTLLIFTACTKDKNDVTATQNAVSETSAAETLPEDGTPAAEKETAGEGTETYDIQNLLPQETQESFLEEALPETYETIGPDINFGSPGVED